MKSIGRLPFPNLLDELKIYSDEESLRRKVMRVYWKCVKSGRIGIANRIEIKYRQHFPKSDLVMAFGMSLLAIAKRKT